jgi:preprotein translocase subunit SecG
MAGIRITLGLLKFISMKIVQYIIDKTKQTNFDKIISYKKLQIMMGLAGILLPLLVVAGKYLSEGSGVLEDSVSDYYNNGTGGDILVGILFALSFFLFAYKGPEGIDSIIADIGGAMALGVALFPTTSENKFVSSMHFIFAALLFATLIIFSLYLFRKTKKTVKPTPEKIKRNRIYFCCGIIMIVCIVGMFVCYIALNSFTRKYNIIFWGETIALVSFGFSWLTKAEWLYLVDEPANKIVVS